jgi:SAM-dependent methyltransferase
MNNHDASAAFYDTWAERYDAALAQNHANNAVRSAFHALVQQQVPTGSLIMDFGCGTGTDALAYIQMGYRVVAYDNSPGMMAALEQKGATEIAKGDLVTVHGRYETMMATLPTLPRPVAVVSNFAVLNQIENAGEWLTAMAGVIDRGGWIIISVLNPTYWWDMRQSWWWRGLRSGGSKGYVEYPTSDGFHTYRHLVGSLKDHAYKAGLRLKLQQGAGILLPLERAVREKSFLFRLAGTLERQWGRMWGVRGLGNFLFLAWQKE